MIVARRKDDGLKALPVQQAELTNETRMQEVLSATQAAVVDRMLSLKSLQSVGARIWRIESDNIEA